MIQPNIRYYARLDFDPASKKTPKYVITAEAGYYPPMEQLKGRDGKVSMFLMDKLKEGANVPSMRLQAKNSLNFTGLKDYFVDGKLSGYAYGYPLADATYSKDGKPNPFFEYKEDGFLFLVGQDEKAATEQDKIRPSYFELVVLEGAKVLVSSYCKSLLMGGFDDTLELLREQAKQANPL